MATSLSASLETKCSWSHGHLGFGEDYQSGDVFATSLIMKRLHLDDLAGYVMPRGQWIHLNLPAIAETEQRIQIGHDEFHQRQVGDLLHEEREPREG